MLPLRDLSQIKRYTKTKSIGLERDISCKWQGKEKAGVALKPNKIDFNTKAIIGDKESHYVLIKGTIQQEDVTLINIYTPNIGEPKYVEQIMMDTKGETDSNTAGALNTLLTSVDRTSRQKTNKDIVALNDPLEQMDLFDIFRAFHPKPEEYTYFSSAHVSPGMFSRVGHMLGHKTNLNKFKKAEIISSFFSDHTAMKLENCQMDLKGIIPVK